MSNRRPHIAARFLALSILVACAGLTSARQPFHGNARTGVYHQSSCRYYSCPNCTVRLDSAEEAKEQGFRPCKVCNPDDGSEKKTVKPRSPYIGDVESHHFHRSSCRFASCANCTARFKTREEAFEAGYTPGKCCDP